MANRRVLVADDEAHHRWLIRLALEGTDFEVVAEARDGLEVVEAALREQPDVVLLDVDMPGRDGLAALERVRAAAPAAQVVLMTAYADEPGLADRAQQHGVGILDKGDDVCALAARLGDELSVTRSARPRQVRPAAARLR